MSSNIKFPSFGETQCLLEYSLFKLAKNDAYLIDGNLKEECINHKLAIYLAENLRERNLQFCVDIEYNKNIDDEKKRHDDKCMRPDIIIHHRGHNLGNYLAIESKKWYPTKNDKGKINELLSPPYNYKFGCLIIYNPKNEHVLYKLGDSSTDFTKVNKRNCEPLSKISAPKTPAIFRGLRYALQSPNPGCHGAGEY